MSRAEAIRHLRIRRQETQAEFAAMLGVGRGTVSTWENGQEISLRHARALVELGLDISYVIPAAPTPMGAQDDSSERGAA
jgi:transcriptional regulator with XRE-family HTH domain